ncbi:hypothetical protein D3C84_441120 [compost metagenome]
MAEVLHQGAVQCRVLPLDALPQLLRGEHQGIAGLAQVDLAAEVAAIARRWQRAAARQQHPLRTEARTAEQLHGVVRHAHGQLGHLPLRSRQAQLEDRARRLRIAEVEVEADTVAVVADKTHDLRQGMADAGRVTGDQGDGAEHMEVLVLGHAQAEIGAGQLLGRALQQAHQRT